MLLASLFFMAAMVADAKAHKTSDMRDNSSEITTFNELNTASEQQEEFFFSPYSAMANMPLAQEAKQISGRLLGDRNFLTTHGVDFFATYTSNIAGNPVGGFSPGGFTYADFFYLGCTLNSQELLGFPGGSLNMSAAQVDGNGLSENNIGNQFSAQQTFVGQTFYWYELFYKQYFCDNHANLKIGRLSNGNDFATSPLYWFYMNAGIDGSPQALLNNEGISYYATATWGSSLKAHLSRSTVAGIGVYQVTEGSIKGFNWDFYPNDGVLLIGQFSWNPIFSSEGAQAEEKSSQEEESSSHALAAQTSKNPVGATSVKNFQGHYWMGGYYSTSTYNQSLSMSQQPNSFGLYWHADQTVYKPDPKSAEGLILWTVLTLSPQQSIAFMPFQANAGAVYTGLIPGRRNDTTILGVAYGSFSPNYATSQQQEGSGYPTYELAYEGGYRINLTPAIYIQPDLQWIINPGGTGSIPNALVIGAQMGVTF